MTRSIIIAAVAAGAAIGCGSRETVLEPVAVAPEPTPTSPRPAPGMDLDGPIPAPERGGPATRGASKVPEELLADRAIVKVSVPRPPRGGSVGFEFDGDRRGWIASVPDGEQLPAVAYGGGKIYASGGFGSVSFYALDAHTGRIDWATTNLEDNGPTAAIYEDDRVIFNTESCTLFALDARTGRRLWFRWLGDPTLAQVAVAGGLVFAAHPASNGQMLSAYRVKDGAPVWSRWIGSEVLAAPVISGDSVYASTIEGLTFRFARADGKLRWMKPLRATTAPWIAGDELFVTRRAGAKEQQIVVEAATGKVVREHAVSRGAYAWDVPADTSDWKRVWAFEGSRPVVDRGVRYVAMGGEIHATDARTGEALWHRRYPGKADQRALSSVAIAGSNLVFATRDGKLFGLDIDTGYTLWSYDVGLRVIAEPIIAKGWIYATTEDGHVVALDIADPTLDGWHMFGGNPHHNGLVAPPPPRPVESPQTPAPAPALAPAAPAARG